MYTYKPLPNFLGLGTSKFSQWYTRRDVALSTYSLAIWTSQLACKYVSSSLIMQLDGELSSHKLIIVISNRSSVHVMYTAPSP